MDVGEVRARSGSLGQGLGTACGMAWARKKDEHPGRVFTLMGDGEVAEGSVFEAAAFAAHEGLDNLVAIVDVNGYGQSGPTMQAHETAAYARRFEAFGWAAVECDGHDMAAVDAALGEAEKADDRPRCIVAYTTKGRGVSYMENNPGFHGKAPTSEQLIQALSEIEAGL